MKPSVLVTRRIPSAVLAKLEAACEVDIYRQGDLPHDELVARVAGKQGLLSVVTDSIDRAVFEAGRDLKVVSTIAVGYNNIDMAAARERQRHGDQHAGCPDGSGRRSDLVAHPQHDAAHCRG